MQNEYPCNLCHASFRKGSATGDKKGARRAHVGFGNGWIIGDSKSATKGADIHMQRFEKNLSYENVVRLLKSKYQISLAMIWDTVTFLSLVI